MAKRPKSPMRGLSIVRGPDAEGRWYWRYRAADEGGEVRTLWAGWATASEAKAAAIAAVAGGEAAALEDAAPRTVRELLRLWLRVQQERVVEDPVAQLADQIRPATYAVYVNTARQLCPPEGAPRAGGPSDLGPVLVSDLREDHLRRWRDTNGLAPKTSRLSMTVLRLAWSWARSRGLVTGECPRVATSNRTVRAKPVPTPGQAAALVAESSGWRRLAILLLATTGARIGEIAALTEDRVRFEPRPEVYLWKKGKEGRWVPLLAEVAAEVAAWMQARGERQDPRPELLLGVAPGTVGVQLRLHLRRLAGEDQRLTPHAFRRLASSTLLSRGVDPVTYQRIMGHSYAMGLQTYAQAGQAEVSAGVELLHLPQGRVITFPGTGTGTTTKKRG